ncbi:helix-turn-helix domain-containing protein [Schleiferilactobacillus harbinensis]|uniref:HTH cro/C1-type domain-containing protein n=1 Tax=Schleiferilactobacillus harbinensis TaxID=304207 RepID=A0A5P8M7W1_9LACO|nr:helix-turn-helix transcriptional regulator [Schleiferilactobacillus harbinensis]QFR24374.1 hypothetical protein D1010_13870 [Schleiferilactobacillus harbinensis]
MIDQLAKRYGQIFHEIRVRRCLTIDQVRGGLDASTVSRFERGLAMISTANLIALLHSAGMSGTEFFNIVGALQPTVIERLMDDIQLADRRADRPALQEAVQVLKKNTEGSIPAQILVMVVNGAITRITVPAYQFAATDQDRIADYLTEEPTWFKLEYFIFNQAVPSLSAALNLRLYRNMMRSFAANRLLDYTGLVGSSLAKLAVVWLRQEDWNTTYRMIHDAKQYLAGANSVLITYRAQLIKLAANYLDARDGDYLLAIKTKLAFFQTVDPAIYQADLRWLRLLQVPV